MYISYEERRAFEDTVGWENILSTNKRIGKFLKFEPTIEYAVGNDDCYCYSPSSLGGIYSHPHAQKAECDRYLREQLHKFPNGWVTKDGFKTKMLEHYPSFHTDWNELIECVKRLKALGIEISIDCDNPFNTWGLISQNCK